MYKDLEILKKNISSCYKCERLVAFRQEVAKKKRKQYKNEIYWGKPVSGFGDKNAELLIVGLAPAAHGANRTGRVFTGDRSADFLFKCLYNAKISNLKKSENIHDKLKLKNTYITLALKCLPPKDKPSTIELNNCLDFFKNELRLLKNIKFILALGKIAFDYCVKVLDLEKKKFKFIHSVIYNVNDSKKIMACYHPSPRNVNTKLINEKQMSDVFKKIRKNL